MLSVSPGEYDLLIYNFGTCSTQIRNGHDLRQIEAYTSEVSSAVRNVMDTKSQLDLNRMPVVYGPDRLLVALETDVSVPYLRDHSVVVEVEATAETVVQDYTLEVRGVTGCGHISRVSFFLTGQSRSCFIGQPGRGLRGDQ